MKKYISFIIIIFLLIAVIGCKKDTANRKGKKDGKLVVYTTFYPTYAFAKALGGDLIEVVNPLPEDEDPIFWMPPREVIKQYQENADLIIINGASFEKWIDKVILPENKIVNTAKPFSDNLIVIESAVTHSHGKGGEHAHEGIDGHTWLSPKLALTQAGQIKDALIKSDPKNKQSYENNYTALVAKLNELDQKITGMTADYDGKTIVASHPAYNYLARDYNLTVKSFDFDPGEMPSSEAIAKFKAETEKLIITHIVWESYPIKEVEEYFVEEFNIKSLEFSPVESLSQADKTAGDDYFSIMNRNIENISLLFK